MLRPTIKTRCTHAYAGLLLLLAVYMMLFVTTMRAQELPNVPQAAIKQQGQRVHQSSPLPKPNSPDLDSADWFRQRGHFRMARFMPALARIDWDISCSRSRETGHGSHKNR